MTDIRVEKLAELLVNYSTAIKQGDKVVIEGSSSAEPLLKEVYIKVLQAGGNPLLLAQPDGIDELFYKYASKKQLKHVPEPIKLVTKKYDARISIWAPDNLKALSNVDPQKMVMHSRSRTELMKIFLNRVGSGDLRWVGVLFPTNASAQEAEMGLREYEDFVYGACLPDLNDPIDYWRRFSAWQQKIVDWMGGKKSLYIKAPETDLRLNIEGRSFVNCDGHENMPDGEVFTGPVEDGVNGHVYFPYPAIFREREVSGVRLWFERGRVIKATANKNEDFLLNVLDTDEGARRLGEFSIGTNEGITCFTRNTLFDEKISGTIHMAIGAGLPESGSKNESAIHWDMVCDLRQGGEIRVDNQLIYKNGKFVIEF